MHQPAAVGGSGIQRSTHQVDSELATRMSGDIDVDCSGVVETGVPLEEMGRRVYRRLIEVASGDRSQSEDLGLGGEEIVPWQIGAVL